jgi:putative transposase
MKYNPDMHHRRTIRLMDYDYSQAGAYFVTICTNDRECYFGAIIGGTIELSQAGRIARDCLLNVPEHNDSAEMDKCIVMPNHIHAIIFVHNNCRGVACNAQLKTADTKTGVIYNAPTNNYYSEITPHKNSLSIVVRSYKSAVTRLCRQQNILFQWQRNYYEHIIRNETELNKIREYIVNNPLNWESDENFAATGKNH